MVMSCLGLGPGNDCAGEDQQQLLAADSFSRQRWCYIRIITARVQLEKNTGRGSQEA
jgi:hypothetical protein